MPLTPEEIQSKSFSIVDGRGYDRSEVANFLEQVASDYRALLKAKLEMNGGAQSDEALGSEMREVLRAAFESAARIRESAQQEAERTLAEAERRANELRDKGERTQAQVHGRTKKETQAIIADANQQVREMKDRAEREAAALLADAQRRFQTMAAHELLLRERIGRIDDLVEKLKEEIQPLAIDDWTEQVASGEGPSRGS
jgi:cell division initiation protein